MEPIDYRRAITRRWPLVLVCAVIGAIVAVLIPVHVSAQANETLWQAQALAGVSPAKGANSKATAASITQIEFYAEQQPVFAATGKALNIKNLQTLRKDVTLKKKKGLPDGSIYVEANQPTKVEAAKLANEFVKQLAAYANLQLANAHKQGITEAQSEVNSLLAQLTSVTQQIQALSKRIKPPPPTTTTTVPKPKSTTTTAAPTTTTTAATTTTSSTTTTTTSSSTTTTTAKSGTATTSTTTVPTSAPTTAPTSVPGQAVSALLLSSSSTTTTTSPSGQTQLQILQTQQAALRAEYTTARAHLNQLEHSPVQTSGFTLLSAARQNQGKEIPPSSNPFAHRSIRGGAGLIGGALIGIALALLLDGLDKRLRKASRASVVFGLPVIAEIPKAPGSAVASRSKRRGRTRDELPVRTRVPVVEAPASVAAEAYRRLRVSVLFMPVTQPGSISDGVNADDNLAGAEVAAQVRARADGQTSQGDVKRKVVLIVTPGLEPTGPEVVANLAAAYAEAGESVLVVTTGDLRVRGSSPALPPVVAPYTSPPPQPATASAQLPTTQLPAAGVQDPSTQQTPVVPGADPTRQIPSVPAEPGSALRQTRWPVTVEEVAAHCRPQQTPGVFSLHLGELLRGPGELATRGGDVLNAARQVADVVLVEVPSLLGTPDGEAVVRSVDVVAVVAECFWTRVDQARRTSDLLRQIQAPTLGVVLTEVEVSRKDLKRVHAGGLSATGRNAQNPQKSSVRVG